MTDKAKSIGITGGIGSGKSVVSDYLAGKGYSIIDADVIAKEIAQPGMDTLNKLIDEFGKSIIHDDGTLNRTVLSDMVFSDKNLLKKLNIIMHKDIKKRIDELLYEYSEKGSKMIFIVAPLLFESGLDKDLDEIWLIDSDKDLRIQRVLDRDGLTKKKVEDIIKNQTNDTERRSKSDIIINNNGNIKELEMKINKLLEERR